jgi:asparagine synthetase B (glutamine-hydrolysing)
LSPQLQQLWTVVEAESESPPPIGLGHTAQQTWTWLIHPNLWWNVELQVLRAARQGFEMRFPFLDRRLADFVLALPPEQRLPHGRMKRLLRRALADLLPPAVAGRTQATTFGPVVRLNFLKNRASAQTLFAESRWLSAAFVDQKAARALLADLDPNCPDSVLVSQSSAVLDIAQLEHWIRGLHERGLVHVEGAVHEPATV